MKLHSETAASPRTNAGATSATTAVMWHWLSGTRCIQRRKPHRKCPIADPVLLGRLVVHCGLSHDADLCAGAVD